MNNLSRLDVFFLEFLRRIPFPVVYLAKTLLGLLAFPVLLVGVVVWAIVFVLHWIGNRVVEATGVAMSYDR